MPLRNVFEVAGRPSDPAFDFTCAFSTILLNHDSVYVPVRKNASGKAIPYVVKRLSLPTNAVIKCESPHVVIEAGDPNEWIMDVVGEIHRVYISGGTWGNNSYGVLRHRNNKEGALNTSVFENMHIQGHPFENKGPKSQTLNRGFQVGSCAGVIWRDVEFFRIANYGILFQVEKVDNGYANSNTIDNCKFQHIQGPSIYFNHIGDANQKIGNRISACWFENSDVASPRGAIKSKGWHYGLIVERCYFEKTGSGSFADIHLEDSTSKKGVPEVIRSVVIRDSVFANSDESQECRVRNIGRVSYIAMDNHVNTQYSTRGVVARMPCKKGGRGSYIWFCDD